MARSLRVMENSMPNPGPRVLRSLILVGLSVVGLSLSGAAQVDPGVPDTVWVDSLTGILGPTSKVGVRLVNDEALTAIEVTLTTSDSLVLVDSVSFVGSRLSGYLVKGWVVDNSSGAVTFYCFPSDEPLVQPDRGLLATVFLSHPSIDEIPYEVTVDSTSIEIDLIFRTTSLRDSVGTVFVPQFREGLLRIEGLSCCPDRTGNINADSGGSVDLSDLIYLVNFLFLGGSEPDCSAAANVNGDEGCSVDLSDLIYFVNYLFLGGPEPAECLTACE